MKLTRTEANELIATKVFGWRVVKRRVDGTASMWSCHEKGMMPPKTANQQNPTDSVEQALEALEAYGKEFGIVRGSDKTYCVSIYGVTLKLRSTNESLSLASCSALCSALLGEQVEIKED